MRSVKHTGAGRVPTVLLTILLCFIFAAAANFPETYAAADDFTSKSDSSVSSTSTLNYPVQSRDALSSQKLPLEQVSISQNNNFAMANISSEADVFAAADATSEVVGKIYPTTSMEVLAKDGEWTQIRTGNLTGYVPASSLMYGDEGVVLMNAKCPKMAVIEDDTNRFSACSLEAEVSGEAKAGETYSVSAQLSGWYALRTGSEDAAETFYVPADTMHVEPQTQAGKTTEELAAEAAAAEQAEAAAAAEEAATAAQVEEVQTSTSQNTQQEAVSAGSDEVDLLAHLIYCEAGSDYEAGLAVGAVVMNRVKSPSFPNTITEVIYQSGQFSPTWNGSLDRAFAHGVPQSCYDAANAAIAGQSNVGGCLYFRSGTNGTYVIGDNAFR